MKHYTLPLGDADIAELTCGTIVTISGTVYTARDAAHKRLTESLNKGETLPLDLRNAAIYYCGPTPTVGDDVIGSCGPTTSSRMDDYAPALMDAGVKVMIGKGKRSETVNKSIREHGAVYFAAIGGAGALYKHKIKSCELVAFPDLGCEAIRKLYIEDAELLVATDSRGNTCLK